MTQQPRIRAKAPNLDDLFNGPEAAARAGVTYRQLNYWTEQGWLRPSRTSDAGMRHYDAREVLKAAILGKSSDAGIRPGLLIDSHRSIAGLLEDIIIELKALHEAAKANHL